MKLKIEPRMLDKTTAAAYCGVTAATFSAECPVAAVKIGGSIRWDRQALDRWLDQLSPPPGREGLADALRGVRLRSTKAEIMRRLDPA